VRRVGSGAVQVLDNSKAQQECNARLEALVPLCFCYLSLQSYCLMTQTHFYSLQHQVQMTCLILASTFALVATVQAAPSQSHTSLYQEDAASMDSKPGDKQLSTEAIIGVIGVVVAVLGIASTLAWSKRRKSRSGPRRSPTSDGAHSCRNVTKSSIDQANMEACTQN